MRSITLTLPMPDRSVSQNAQMGNSRIASILKSKAVKQHRRRAHDYMVEVIARGGLKKEQQPTGYSLSFFYKTMLFRDEGNAEGACKSYIDGICDALKINDRHFNKKALTTQAKDDTQAPRVEITIYFDM